MTRVDFVFVVDEDLSARQGLARLIRTASYEVRDFASVDECLEALCSDDIPGCVILDAGEPGLSPEALVAELEAIGAHPSFIVVTTHDDPVTRHRARMLRASAFFRKPVDGAALLDAIEWAMRAGRTVNNHR